jgi:hypothetical protein
MAFDPLQDPWGAALLVTAALSGLGISATLIARGLSRSATLGGWLMGLGLVGFLGSAVAGAVVRVEAADASSSAPQVDAQPGDDAEAETAKAVAADRNDADDDAAAPSDDGDDGDDDDTDDTREGEAEGAEPQAPASAAVERPAALPSDPEALRAAVRTILRDGKKVAETKSSCADPQQLADAWAKLEAIPDEAWSPRNNVITKKLDGCRRKVVWTTLYVVRHERVNARAAFVSTLEGRLQQDGKAAAVSVHERNHVRLRIGSQSISHEEFAEMLDGGFRKELEMLGFEKVTFSDGSQAQTEQLEPVADQAVANGRLEPYGLGQRFSR